MLKEKIETLDIAENDVLSLSQTKGDIKTKYLQLKKDLKKLLKNKQISKDEYNSQIFNLHTDYKNVLNNLKTKLNDSTTFLVNEYEKFNDYKATNDTSLEKKLSVGDIERQIKELKNLIKTEEDKVTIKVLKSKLKELKTHLLETKTLYSRTIKNKWFLVGGSIIVLSLLVGAFLLAFLYINPNAEKPLNVTTTEGLTALIIIILGTIITLAFFIYQIVVGRKKWVLDRKKKTASVIPSLSVIMAFDTLGLGCFATITSLFKKNGLFSDNKKIAGTLNAGTAIGTISGVLLTTAVAVQIWTLIAFVGMALVGAGIGAYLVKRIKTKKLTLVMGLGLSVASIITLLACKGIDVLPKGELTGLADSENWWKLIIGMICFTGLGMLLSFGIGVYAPAMVIVPLLGMSWVTTLPIMLLSAGFAGQVSAYTSVKNNLYLPKTSWLMTIGTMIGNFLIFAIVFAGINTAGKVDITIIGDVLRWMSVFVIAYSAFLLLKSYFKMRKLTNTPTQIEHLTTIIGVNYQNMLDIIPKINLNYQFENKTLNYQQIHW